MKYAVIEREPGSLPARYELGLGNRATRYNELALAAAIREVRAHPSVWQIELKIGTAPDAHTPYAWEDRDALARAAVSSAVREAKRRVRVGECAYALVTARVWHVLATDKVKAHWTVVSLERGEPV